MTRDAVAIRLIEVWPEINPKHPEREGSYYIDVEGLDDLCEAIRPALSKLPKGRVRAPIKRNCGSREFHVSDKDCTLIFFGGTISG